MARKKPFPPPVPNEAALCEKWGGVAFCVARRYFDPYHPDYAEVVQEARIGLLKGVRTYDPRRSSIQTWLWVNSRSAVLEWWRTKQGIVRVPRPAYDAGERGTVHSLAEYIPTRRPEDRQETYEEALRGPDLTDAGRWMDLGAAWECVPERERHVIYEWLRGRTYVDIGRDLGVSATRAYQLYAQGIGRLRERLLEVGYAEAA